MGRLLNIITPLHISTSRDYLKRMMDEKAECMKVARRYDKEYWDGDRRFGYGGYKYDGRQKVIAQELIKIYGLKDKASILDVGCGKGYLLYELKQLLPKARIRGMDISRYALKNAKEEIKDFLYLHKAEELYDFKDKEFDLVVSIATLHNLPIFGLKAALKEIERVGRNKYIAMESYRNERELFNLQCWALTCEAFFTPQQWEWLFREFGYSGDYEFIYFQ